MGKERGLMSLHTIEISRGSRQRRNRVGRGRGSGKGKTCGKGTKGQMSRAGHKHKLGFEGGQIPLLRRLPKRGFKNPTRVAYTPISLLSLAAFDDGSSVGVEEMMGSGLARGRGARVKILGTGGTMDRKLHVKAHAFSASARQAIEAAGGSCEVIT